MKTTLMGVITVDPKQTLEEGIRKQFVKKIIAVLYAALIPAKSEVLTQAKFNPMIDAVGGALDGIRNSFEYMGDYVNMDGLRI
jgi:WASH complex subunit strumpellin